MWKVNIVRLLPLGCVYLLIITGIHLVETVDQCKDPYSASDSVTNKDNPFFCASLRRSTTTSTRTNIEYRTNGIEHFCIVVKDGDGNSSYGGVQSEDNFQLLAHLVKNKAWSYQLNDDFPRSGPQINEIKENDPLPPCNETGQINCECQPPPDIEACSPDAVTSDPNVSPSSINCGVKDPPCPFIAPKLLPVDYALNPYFVETTGIALKGELLHNWLHFRVFMNRSVRDIKSRLHGDGSQQPAYQERKDNARGVITAMIMMVKDQDGWPVGDFNQDLPCDRTCKKYVRDVYQGDRRNAVPCAFTPPRATSHPGMFIFDVDPGVYTEAPPGQPAPPPPPTPAPAPGPGPGAATTAPAGRRKKRQTEAQPQAQVSERRQGVREVHATWSFNQDTCNFVTELHIQTLIFEDVITSRNDSNGDARIYGWTAQYNILHPKGKSSLGAADYVDIEYWKDRNLRVDEIDCHVALFDAIETTPTSFTKGRIPQNILGSSNLKLASTVSPVPSISPYLFSLSAIGDEIKEYYGQHGKEVSKCRGPSLRNSETSAVAHLKEITSRSGKTGTLTVEDYIKKYTGVRCPCPALPSTEPIENRTADPSRRHGRLMHASHMTLAYMLLVPLACFVARYYKETFVTVFCFQEYWWFMWHVVLLIGAAGFIAGAILSVIRRKEVELHMSDNLLAHIILGWISIAIFFIEIFTGFFRHSNPTKRMRQIFTHWLIGVLNNCCAIGSMFAMAWQNDSGMSCYTVGTIVVWLLFVILWYVIMEINMYSTDKKIGLKPPRTYLPPPVKRLFTRDAPGRTGRMVMLGLFIIILIGIQVAVSYLIWHSGGSSCYEEWHSSRNAPIELVDDYEDSEGQQQDEY